MPCKHGKAVIAITAIAVMALLMSCGSSSSPTEPQGFADNTAVIAGEVSTGTAATARPNSIVAADVSGAGIRVSVRGTSLSTVTDNQGAFDLPGVPPGDRMLLFETSNATAPLPISNVQANERITLSVTVRGQTASVTSMNRSGGSGDGELNLELAPDVWNTNYGGSSGLVTVFIRGQGLSLIDLDSIKLVSEPGAPLAELSADLARLEGSHVRATFPQSQVLELLNEPEPGSRHEIAVSFTADGGTQEFDLAVGVRVAG